jgi:hypothetical protein
MTTFEGMTEEDQLNTLMAELKDSNIRQSVMEYIANKSEAAPGMTDKQRLSKMIETIAAESVTNQKSSALWKSRTKKSILLGIVAVIVAITVQFLVNFFSNELSKESHVTGKGTMVGTDGSVVKTQMDEMRVNADGQLTGRSSVKTIKTTPSLNRIALASSLPDSTLMALDEITVYSDKGHTLRVKVQGFSRIPVLNSKCGNLVHFYTAWNGRITLDSTELSFDKDTESQFKDAGFSLAVGGFGGRRLAGGSRSNAFFKHVDKLKKSGSWTCADVPLPTSVNTYMSRETMYEPCLGHGCYSDYGGLKLGVAKLAEAHALAAMSITKRMRKLLKGTATEVFYSKTEVTNIASPSYLLDIQTQPVHFGQEKITLTDRATDKKTTFQVEIGNKDVIAHCKATTETANKDQKKVVADPAVDTDPHMEYLGLVQEDGKTLRHFRWVLSESYSKSKGMSGRMGGEFWDYSETLMPYRTVSWLSGSVFITESWTAKCSDADVSAALTLRTSASIKDLLACKAPAAQEENIPKMASIAGQDDLDEAQSTYYMWQVFGSMNEAKQVVAAGEDNDLTKFADYLVRSEMGGSDGSVSDPCYLACKVVMDAFTTYEDQEVDQCKNGAHDAVVTCLKEAHAECIKMPWVTVRTCMSLETGTSRALEEDEDEAATVVPMGTDGVTDLSRATPKFQAAVAQSLGLEMPKVTLNVTRELLQRRRLGWSDKKSFPNGRPNCKTHWCGECPNIPKNKKGQPSGTAVSKGGRCATCDATMCFMPPYIWQVGKTENMGMMICLSFSLCLTRRLIISLQLKFSQVLGIWIFSIVVEICMEDFQMCFGIPDPWSMTICLGGQLHILLQTQCHQLPGNARDGGCYLRLDIAFGISFWIIICVRFVINVASIEIGVKWGVKNLKQQHSRRNRCWRTDRRRRRNRRRWWNRRRRRGNWGCHWHVWTVHHCDTYCRWYVHVTLMGSFRFGYECYEWTKAKMKEGWLFGEWSIPKGWGWGGLNWKWCRFSKYLCYRKYNRR